jgi:hypothetical protein
LLAGLFLEHLFVSTVVSCYLSFSLTLVIASIILRIVPETYEIALRDAKKELAEAVAELGEAQTRAQELEQRIGDLRQTISVLAKLCGQEDLDLESSLGLTDAIRLAFYALATQSVTAQEMRLHLESQGFNTRRYGNLLASIHTVFSRLEKKGEIRQGPARQDGKVAFVATNTLVVGTAMAELGKVLGNMLYPKPK